MKVLCAIATLVLVCQHAVASLPEEHDAVLVEDGNPLDMSPITPLILLRERVLQDARVNPELYDSHDVDEFYNDQGPLAASNFLAQRSGNWERAVRLAKKTLQWRKNNELRLTQASDFPCDLFKMGLIFEFGHAHRVAEDGQYVQTNPVIWIRLGALGKIIKQIEKPTLGRLVSYAYNTPRTALSRLRNSFSGRRGRRSRVARRKNLRRPRLIRDRSARNSPTLTHVLRAIAWWIDDWTRRNPESQATLVMDFENIDSTFTSWSVGNFLTSLDGHFPGLFDRIIAFRYRPRLWHNLRPISMLNRMFKTYITSAPETDRKLSFVKLEPDIDRFIPQVDSEGFSLLPQHVSGECHGPDDSLAPAGCQNDLVSAQSLYNPEFWQALNNEFYRICKPKRKI